MNALDRIAKLKGQSLVTGIDFIYVHPDQTTLDVHFLRPPATLSVPMTGALGPQDVSIYSPSGAARDAFVLSLLWITVNGEDVMQLKVAEPGDFTLYKLRIDDLRIDPYYNDVTFDFKANCPSDLDCDPPEHECPPETLVDFPIDYQARDFWSFRQALLEFASQRYPDWPDRLEADAGVMLAEVMSALGDEMAYYQDRVAREAYLETATQRRSLRRHARLVDYHLHDGLSASSWLDVTVSGTGDVPINAGRGVWTASDNGQTVYFEIGKNLEEQVNGIDYKVNANRNEFKPHCWDKDDVCLPVGATEMYLSGHHKAALVFDDQIGGKPGQVPGKWVLLQTVPTNPAQPARVQLVRVVEVTDTTDPVLNNAPITKIVWEKAQALLFEMDMTDMRVRGNMVPATAGQTQSIAHFVVRGDQSNFDPPTWELLRQENSLRTIPRAVEREGRDGTTAYLFTLPDSDKMPLARIGDTPQKAAPEVILEELEFNGLAWVKKGREWVYKSSLIGVNSSQPLNTHFTLDDGSWRRVVGYQRLGEEFVHQDYASNAGVTIRFGDGEFGRIPDEKTVFRVYYRLGGGRRSNVAADTLIHHSISGIETITNPMAAANGLDAETPAELRMLAPDAFRAVTYRAVRPEDYAEAAERLPEVQRAGATFRWTGSWLSAFVAPDPYGAVALEAPLRRKLVRHLDRFRQAGREVHVPDPVYANMDLEIDICVAPDAYTGEVKERVMEVLSGKKGVSAKQGYFSADNFTFGTPLERSTLEAAIQAVPGVKAVENIRFRRRGWFEWQVFADLRYNPGKNAVIRVENDPLNPERGTFKIYTHGGA